MRFDYEDEWIETFIGKHIIQEGKRAKGKELDYLAFSVNNDTGFSTQSNQWEGASYVSDSKEGYKVVRKDNIAYNPARINVGSIGLFAEKTGIVSSLYVVFSTKDDLLPEFLYQYMKSKKFNKNILKLQEGGVRSYFFFDKLSSSRINIPAVCEQKKIVDFLSLINKRIYTQKKIIENKTSLMYSIINSYLKNKPANRKLFDVAEIVKGRQINADNFSDEYEYEVYNGGISSSGKYSNYNAEKCISISEGGNSCGFVNYIEKKFWSGGHNYTLNVKNDVNGKYLYFQLKAKEKDIMNLRVGSGLPNIQKSTLQDFNIYLPPLDEQNYITEIISSIDNDIMYEKRIFELYQKQKDYLLNKMFI